MIRYPTQAQVVAAVLTAEERCRKRCVPDPEAVAAKMIGDLRKLVSLARRWGLRVADIEVYHSEGRDSAGWSHAGTTIRIGFDAEGRPKIDAWRYSPGYCCPNYQARIRLPEGHWARGPGRTSHIAEAERGSRRASRLRWGTVWAHLPSPEREPNTEPA